MHTATNALDHAGKQNSSCRCGIGLPCCPQGAISLLCCSPPGDSAGAAAGAAALAQRSVSRAACKQSSAADMPFFFMSTALACGTGSHWHWRPSGLLSCDSRVVAKYVVWLRRLASLHVPSSTQRDLSQTTPPSSCVSRIAACASASPSSMPVGKQPVACCRRACASTARRGSTLTARREHEAAGLGDRLLPGGAQENLRRTVVACPHDDAACTVPEAVWAILLASALLSELWGTCLHVGDGLRRGSDAAICRHDATAPHRGGCWHGLRRLLRLEPKRGQPISAADSCRCPAEQSRVQRRSQDAEAPWD